MWTCFYMSHFSVLCSVLLELPWRAWGRACKTWQVGSWGCQGLWTGGMSVSCIPDYQWDGFTFFFFLENCGKPGKVSNDFFSLLNKFVISSSLLSLSLSLPLSVLLPPCPSSLSPSLFIFLSFFFFKDFYMIHMLKPGLCWVEYILSIRGLFLPTVSWNLADGST